jgi:hypothetical protein
VKSWHVLEQWHPAIFLEGRFTPLGDKKNSMQLKDFCKKIAPKLSVFKDFLFFFSP